MARINKALANKIKNFGVTVSEIDFDAAAADALAQEEELRLANDGTQALDHLDHDEFPTDVTLNTHKTQDTPDTQDTQENTMTTTLATPTTPATTDVTLNTHKTQDTQDTQENTMNTMNTMTTTPATPATTDVTAAAAVDNLVTKSDKIAAGESRTAHRFSYTRNMRFIEDVYKDGTYKNGSCRTAIEEIHRNLSTVWLENATKAVADMSTGTVYGSAHQANRARIRQLKNYVLEMIKKTEQVLLPTSKFPMPLPQYIEEMQDHDILNTPYMGQLSYYDDYMIMYGDQSDVNDRSRRGMKWLSGKLKQYATVDVGSDCWKLTINGGVYNISAKQLFTLIASSTHESQITSYEPTCVFATDRLFANPDGHTVVIDNTMFVNTALETISLGTIRLSMPHRYYMAIVVAVLHYTTEDEKYAEVGKVTQFVFGEEFILPSNAVNFERWWRAYNLLVKCVKDVYYAIDADEVLKAFTTPNNWYDRNHITSWKILQSEDLMYEAMKLTEQDAFDIEMARLEEKAANIAKAAAAPRVDVRKQIVQDYVPQRPFGNKQLPDM